MTILRHLHVLRYRGLAEVDWAPKPGVNGLIGPGDSGKSSLLDAIDLVLAPRRNLTLTDADFHNLDVREPIEIKATLGGLPDSLQDLDLYGQYLRGWNPIAKAVVDEPVEGLEVVLTIRLIVDSDLEAHWSLFSERAANDGHARDLPFAERVHLAPSRLGAFAHHHFSWGGRSILNKISAERASASQALAEAAREARKTFGDRASAQVAETLKIVEGVAASAGVRGALEVQALLDAHGVSFNGGAIALHDGAGIPLRNLGIGSSRLLVANLQAVAGTEASISLIDELEHGLEPFRIARLLHTLGSKSAEPAGQVFLTTHSPICVRELAANQLWKMSRDLVGRVSITEIGAAADDQATLRACAEAFLAPNVLVCEGATELGMARGLDLYWSEHGGESLAGHGVALADGGGSNFVARALCFAGLGYRTGLWRDSDVAFTQEQSQALHDAGVTQFCWAPSFSTEQQLFDALPEKAMDKAILIAIDHCGKDSVRQHLRNLDPKCDLDELQFSAIGDTDRVTLGGASGRYKWFKTVDQGERLGREVLGPHLEDCAEPVPGVIAALKTWFAGADPYADLFDEYGL